jgi:hypothetical protein
VQIEIPVIVDVYPRSALAVSDAVLRRRHIESSEASSTVIPIQDVPPGRNVRLIRGPGDEQIGIAVIIEVAPGHAPGARPVDGRCHVLDSPEGR